MKNNNLTADQKRANRVVVNACGNGWIAEFYKTHFLIGTISTTSTGWKPSEGLTVTGQREEFRQWAIENAHEAGVIWKPEDMREDWNVRVPKYENDELVYQDIDKMIIDLVLPNLDKEIGKLGITFIRADKEDIVPTQVTSKGNPIPYVTDGRYDKNNNWAWGTIDTTLVFDYQGNEIYVTRQFQLVSGCLKKMRITKPDFEAEIRAQIVASEITGA